MRDRILEMRLKERNCVLGLKLSEMGMKEKDKDLLCQCLCIKVWHHQLLETRNI